MALGGRRAGSALVVALTLIGCAGSEIAGLGIVAVGAVRSV